jgi:HAE1 family hydrophobic/amphiphilic exporter-1
LDSLVPRLARIQGLVDLRSSHEVHAPEMRFIIDPEAAAVAGVTPAEVVRQVGGGVRERHAADIQSPHGTIPVSVASQVRPDGSDLEELDIAWAGARVPVKALGRWERAMSDGDRRRFNRDGAAEISANVQGRSLAAVLADIRTILGHTSLPADVRWEFGGEFEEMRESLLSMVMILSLSVVSVFMILAAQYESFRWPLVVLLLSPLAATGTVAALLMGGEPYTVFSLVGVVIMIGAIDNDAVIVVDVAVALRRQGRAPLAALREAYRHRIRSIVLTTATTVLGMFPFLVGVGTGLELVTSLTLPLAGGLVASTLATLILLPPVYLLFDRRRSP